jgi:hypothetical protein
MSGSRTAIRAFFFAQIYAEFEFVPDAGGMYTSMVLHQHGRDALAKRD